MWIMVLGNGSLDMGLIALVSESLSFSVLMGM
jgi:hypothetical protein